MPSLTCFHPQSLKSAILATFLWSKEAAPKKTPSFLKKWGFSASRDQLSRSYWSPNLGGMRQGRQPRLGFPPLHPFSPFDLNQPTTNGRGSKRVRTWWKEEKPTPSKRLSPKEGPNKSKWGKWGLTRGVILRSHLRPRPYSNAGWSSSACQCLYQGLSRREGRLCG